MTTRTWIGGGNNKADNAKDWSPNGVPQPGDTLTMAPGTTMNVEGNDLAGNTLTSMGDNDVVNLSKGAVAIIVSGLHTQEINIRDTDTVTLSGGGQTVNIAPNSEWVGVFNTGGAFGGNVTVNGGPHATFLNQGTTVANGKGTSATINIPVVGTGTFNVGGEVNTVEFASSVSAGQHIDARSNVTKLDDPRDFLGSITLSGDGGYPGPAKIDLEGLANADSYTFKNDMLSIFSGKSIIDTLKLTDSTQFGFDVVKSAGSVNVVALTSSGETLPGALPIHMA